MEERPATVLNREDVQQHQVAQQQAREAHAQRTAQEREAAAVRRQGEREELAKMRHGLTLEQIEARDGAGGSSSSKVGVSGSLPAFQAALEKDANATLPAMHVASIRNAAIKKGGGNKDQADALAMDMGRLYVEIVNSGVNPQKALNYLLGKDDSLERDESVEPGKRGSWRPRRVRVTDPRSVGPQR
jgi:hypothetical protein